MINRTIIATGPTGPTKPPRPAKRRQMLFLRALIAGVWLAFGVAFKIFGLVPRHELIVARVLGEDLAGPITLFVGALEAVIGIWFLSGIRLRLCAVVQTLAIIAMNFLEIALARDLLLAPAPMLIANTFFLALVWYCAFNSPVEKGGF